MYRFDFGSRTVPNKAKMDIERYRSEFSRYSTLVQAVCIDDFCAAGNLLQGYEINDFIMDRSGNTVWMQDENYKWLRLVGISGGCLIYIVDSNKEVPDKTIPDEILRKIRAGSEVIALVKTDSIRKHFRS